MTYTAPVKETMFLLKHVCGLDKLEKTGKYPDLSEDLAASVLEQAGKFLSAELAPLNRVGDEKGATLKNGEVTTAPGFKQAYGKFVEGGWQGLSFPVNVGGMGLPNVLGTAFMEMMQSANMAFGLGPMLTMGAIEVLIQAGSEEQKKTYLSRLITGEWSASMCLTEPQAGSDVGALCMSATAQDDGSFHLKGQKIFITWGEHDCTDNIIHLVLARTQGSPKGTAGLSLFLVPKFLPDAKGEFTIRNAVKAIGLEHKMGIHGSPTCTMEHDGSTGWLVGDEGKGMAMMFIMMNSARLNVGAQGVGIAERAWQQAYHYAAERKQGRDPETGEYPTAIANHPDVRRMLVGARAKIDAARALCLACSHASDMAQSAETEEKRARAKRREDFLTPLAKSYGSEMGVAVSSMGIQVHGGMGYIEETGAAQHFRDARITPIYEGTNGIQAMDFAGRKLRMEGGKLFLEMADEIRETAIQCDQSRDKRLQSISTNLNNAVTAMETAAKWMAETHDSSRDNLGGAFAFQMLCAETAAGYYLAKGARASSSMVTDGGAEGQEDFFQDRIHMAHIYARTVLAGVPSRLSEVQAGGNAWFGIPWERLAP